MKKVVFDIQGMTYSSCSAHVERVVKKLEAIKKVNVNLLSNSKEVSNDKIKEIIEELGFEVIEIN